MSIVNKGGVLMWKEAPVSSLSSQKSIVDKGGVMMWKEAISIGWRGVTIPQIILDKLF